MTSRWKISAPHYSQDGVFVLRWSPNLTVSFRSVFQAITVFLVIYAVIWKREGARLTIQLGVVLRLVWPRSFPHSHSGAEREDGAVTVSYNHELASWVVDPWAYKDRSFVTYHLLGKDNVLNLQFAHTQENYTLDPSYTRIVSPYSEKAPCTALPAEALIAYPLLQLCTALLRRWPNTWNPGFTRLPWRSTSASKASLNGSAWPGHQRTGSMDYFPPPANLKSPQLK